MRFRQAIAFGSDPFVDGWNERRGEIAKRYTEGLKDLVATPSAGNNPHVYHLYVIQTPHRDQLQDYLLDRGIQTLIHYPIPAIYRRLTAIWAISLAICP